MRIENIKSKLKLITGLHIGASDDAMKIGGIDSPVLKREILANDDGEISFNGTNSISEPYIPGSSLKGKVRSLLEHYFRLIDPSGSGDIVSSQSDFGDKKKRDLIVKLFGENATNNVKPPITRLIFRDCFITKEVRKAKLENRVELFEEKPENVIDRITGTTKKGGLRHIERVPSGIEFDFEVSIRIFEDQNDNEELFENTLKLGLKLLELDTLGGSGSRGYGKVKFSDITEDINDLSDKVEKLIKESQNENHKIEN